MNAKRILFFVSVVFTIALPISMGNEQKFGHYHIFLQETTRCCYSYWARWSGMVKLNSPHPATVTGIISGLSSLTPTGARIGPMRSWSERKGWMPCGRKLLLWKGRFWGPRGVTQTNIIKPIHSTSYGILRNIYFKF